MNAPALTLTERSFALIGAALERMVRIPVDTTDTGLVTCPQCGREREINCANIRSVRGPIQLNCVCGHSFMGRLDIRQGYVRSVCLDGEFARPSANRPGDMIVEQLSMDGLSFRAMDDCDLQTGDKVEVSFRLDNRRRTEIVRTLRVLDVRGNQIRGRFHNRPPYDPDLGFYLMP